MEAKIIKTGEESFQICANCHSERGEESPRPKPFTLCHSEGEKRPKNLAQDRLREGTRQNNLKTEPHPTNENWLRCNGDIIDILKIQDDTKQARPSKHGVPIFQRQVISF
ncbi:MAG: hypothetical protein GH152_00960 [Dehalococcoidia bacterium]|nr:hypothetical protein [Dehalococcoidia bacterium]